MLKNLYLIVGKSGSGKDTLVRELHQRYGYAPLCSYTDRPPRFEGEDTHVFVTTSKFNSMLSQMLAYTQFDGHQYGSTQELVDASDLYIIDPDGIEFMREKYHSDRPIRVIGISVPHETLIQRMKARGDTDDMIASRLENDDRKFEKMEDVCDIIVQNNDLETSINTLRAIINHFEDIHNPAVEHIDLIEAEKLVGGVYPERICILFNRHRISQKDAVACCEAGWSPYALELPEKQWLGLFKDQDVTTTI